MAKRELSAREQRLAAALRDNLRRRKAQAREQDDGARASREGDASVADPAED